MNRASNHRNVAFLGQFKRKGTTSKKVWQNVRVGADYMLRRQFWENSVRPTRK